MLIVNLSSVDTVLIHHTADQKVCWWNLALSLCFQCTITSFYIPIKSVMILAMEEDSLPQMLVPSAQLWVRKKMVVHWLATPASYQSTVQ